MNVAKHRRLFMSKRVFYPTVLPNRERYRPRVFDRHPSLWQLLLISGIWQLSSNPGAWLPAAFMFLGALIILIASTWDMLAYKRTRSREVRNGRLPSAANTGELKEHVPRQIPPAGVTEDTTRRLDMPVKDSTKYGDHL